MWYSLVLYFCRIALRCFGMLLTPACIRKTVSGPYPKKQLVFEPATPPNLRELCQSVHLSVHLACQTPSNSKISTESQLSNLPINSSPTPSWFTSPGSTSLSFTSLALSAQPLMQSSRKGSTNWSGAMPVVRLATWSRERWKMATQQWWKYETMKITTK